MLTVACVLSEGPRRAYDRSHVARLQAMVARHLDAPHCFVCIDDAPWPGWWAKIALFAPDRFAGRVLYLDLDVTITGDLAPLAQFAAPFAIIKDWNRPGFNSSVMAWQAGAADRLCTGFDADVMRRLAGDQDWIAARMPDAATFPLGWCVSYRRDVRPHNHVPGSARVVCYHGFPKPWDVEAA